MNNNNSNKLKPFFTDEYLTIVGLSSENVITCLNQMHNASTVRNYINVLFDLERTFINTDNVFASDSIEYKIYHEIDSGDIITKYSLDFESSHKFLQYISLISNTLSYVDKIIQQRIILDKLFGCCSVNDKNSGGMDNLPLYYDDEHKIILNNKCRYISLICLAMWIYATRNESEILHLIDFIKHLRTSGSGDDAPLFDVFHKFIHLSKKYSVEDVEFKFKITQSYLLMKSLYILSKYDDSGSRNDRINHDIIYDECEFDCMLVKSGSDTVWSNVVLSSIYLFKSKYDNFNLDRYDKFTKFYSNTIIGLGSIFKSRANYKYLYAMGILLSLKFLNINNTNENSGEAIIKSDVVTDDMFSENNDAFCVAVKRNAKSKTIVKRNIVVEKQVDAYLIYDVFSKELSNIRDVYYSLSDLNKGLSGENKEDVIGIINGGSFQCHNLALFVSYLIVIVMFIIVIALIIKNNNNNGNALIPLNITG